MLRQVQVLLKQQRGALLALTGILLPSVICFSALAVDLSYIYTNKEHMQNAVDAAALAGASQLSLTTSDDASARQLAQDYINYNNENPDNVPDSNIIINHYPTDKYSTIQVVETRDVPLYFMRYLLKPVGITSMRVSVTATAKAIPGEEKKNYDLKNNPLFKYAVIANKIDYSKTLFNGSTKLSGPDFTGYNQRYKDYYHKDPTNYNYYLDYYLTHGTYPSYTDWRGRTYYYDETSYNTNMEGYYHYNYYYDLRYASSTKVSATIVGKYNTFGNRDYLGDDDGNSYFLGNNNIDTRLSSTNSNVSDLITLLNSLLPDSYADSFLQSSPTIQRYQSYMQDGVYFNTSTDAVTVNFKYNNPIDNPENPYYQLNKVHEGGSAIIGGVKYSVIISNGDITTLNVDNQNSTDNTNTYNEPVLLISINGNVTIDEDTPHHHFNGIVYAPKGTVTVKTPYDGSIVAKNVTYAPYYWPGALSPVSGDSSYFGITDRYKEYEAVYYGGDYTKGSVMLIK